MSCKSTSHGPKLSYLGDGTCHVLGCQSLPVYGVLCTTHYLCKNLLGVKLKCPPIVPKFRRSVKGRLNNNKLSAKKRGLEWTISLQEYEALLTMSCYYCRGVLNKNGSALDRINNDIGYILTNVVSCCGNCNVARGDRYSVEEFQVMIKALLAYRSLLIPI